MLLGSRQMISSLVQQIYLHTCTRCWSQVLSHKSQILTKRQCRLYTSSTPQQTYRLISRGLVQLQGDDVVPLLQGLVTSDVDQIGGPGKAQYAMLLNVQGRVQYDLILYDVSHHIGDNSLLVECDSNAVADIMKLIKRYKIRKKVEILNKSEELSVMATFPNEDSNAVEGSSESVVIETKDPRVPFFGNRIILPSDKNLGVNYKLESSETCYHERRYKWGIPEGIQDLPTGNCLPLESNLIFMNGVNFNKGCYLGQELTARTHHAGVTRKRLMPVTLDKPPAGEITPGETVLNEKGKSVGKFRNCIGLYGLALLRIAEAKGTLQIQDKNGSVMTLQAVIPSWWPKDS